MSDDPTTAETEEGSEEHEPGFKEEEPEFRSTLDTPGIAREDEEEALEATRTNEPGEDEDDDE